MIKKTATVVLPCYNSDLYLKSTLDTIFSQQGIEFEVIAINDGSTDQTGQILEDYKIKHKNLAVVHQENKGEIPAYRRGIELASSDFIVRHDADDLMLPGRLSMQVNWMESNPHVHAAGSWIYRFNSNKNLNSIIKIPGSPSLLRFLFYFFNQIANPTSIVRTKYLKDISTPDINIGGDLALWLKMLSDLNILGNMPFPTIRYRIHPGQATSSEKLDKIRLMTEWVYDYYKPTLCKDDSTTSWFNAGKALRSNNLEAKELTDIILTNINLIAREHLESDASATAIGLIRLYYACADSQHAKLIEALKILHKLKILKALPSVVIDKFTNKSLGDI